MTLWESINFIFLTNGISFEIGGIILLGLCAMIMSIQDWRIGVISLFMGSVLEFIVFYYLAVDTTWITYVLFISIILMAFSIYSVRSGGQLVG